MTTSWDAELAARVGRAVKQQRESRAPKLSAAKLAERTTLCGFSLTKAQVSDLELGRKKTVTVAELVVLAMALGVPPVELLYPDLPHGPVDVWPQVEVPSIAAVQWFSGEVPAQSIAEHSLAQGGSNLRVQLSRRYVRAKQLVSGAAHKWTESQASPDRAELSKETAALGLSEARAKLQEVSDQIREKGWPFNDA